MIRQDIILGTYHYIVDLYKASKDLNENYRSKFVMLRNFDINGDIMYDKDLYFVDKDILTDVINGSAEIIYPITNKDNVGFSTDFREFNTNFNQDNFYITQLEDKPSMVYNLYNRDPKDSLKFIEAEIKCDKVKIYHPHTKKSVDSIVYSDLYLNNIHVHLFCQQINKLNINSENEFQDNHNFYSEYCEFYLPNIEELFSKTVYYKENLTFIQCHNGEPVYNKFILNDGTIFIDKYSRNYTDEIFLVTEDSLNTLDYEYDEIVNPREVNSPVFKPSDLIDFDNHSQSVMATLKLFTIPYSLDYDENEKIYYKNYVVNDDPVVTQDRYGINIALYPYLEIDNDSNYLLDPDLAPNKDQFVSDMRFTIASKIGFANNIVSIVNIFNYPNKENFTSFAEAYQTYNRVPLSEYTGIIDDEDEDYDPQNPQEQKQCGFYLEIFSDMQCKNRVCKQIIELENPETELDNFAFNINNIFTKWSQYPDILIARCKFIDKYLGRIITGNLVPITKEYFKYLINDSDKGRLSITGTQQKIKKTSDMDLSKFNFINNINCTVVREASESTQQIATKQNNQRVIYRPIFFKTADLQNISLVNGLKQNVGINLSEYMTKVDTFKINIDGNQFVEYGRNDVFVIFPIDASKLVNSVGTYHILTQDDEYISSGEYIAS